MNRIMLALTILLKGLPSKTVAESRLHPDSPEPTTSGSSTPSTASNSTIRSKLEISVTVNTDSDQRFVPGDGYIVFEGSEELLCQAIGVTMMHDTDLRDVWLHAMAHGDTDALIRELQGNMITIAKNHKKVVH